MENYCEYCVNPANLGIINPETGSEMLFFKSEQKIVCEVCYDMLTKNNLPSRQHFNDEFDQFLSSNKQILFAYSGGLDSTVVLGMLNDECRNRGIELISFTIDTSVKGLVTRQNIEKILDYFNIRKSHFFIDVSDEIQDDPKILNVVGIPMATVDVYKKCLEKGILPCGKICNTMLDKVYERTMKKLGFNHMVTGGDTPKKNSKGIYSLYWKKPSGIMIIRGGYAFGLTKSFNTTYVKENHIPWVHPECGGYDTDCLIPGVFFSEGLDHKASQKSETVVKKYPIILDYLSERVRFGTINRSEALHMLENVDIASEESYKELLSIFKTESSQGGHHVCD